MINMQKIVKIYGERRAINGLDLAVHSGEFVNIKGNSGAGKSTLAMILCGVVRPEMGSLFIMGKDVLKVKRNLSNNIGFVGSEPVFVSSLTLEENIALPLTAVGMYKEKRIKIVRKAMDNMGIRALSGADPTKVSPFKRALAGFVRAIITNPAVLVCDEPTHTLDNIESEKLIKHIKDYCNEQRCVVMLTTAKHAFADKTYTLEKGVLL